jgi:AAA+ ATPase superfamily predicted ATPase
MNHLMRLGYVQRRLPLVPGNASRKQTRYAINDPLLRFWFRFVAPNQSMIRAGPPERIYATLIQPFLEAFCGAGFEQLCREALPHLYRTEGLTGKYSVGEYWSPEAQIDVVGLRADGWTDLGECKWGQVRSLEAIANELTAKAALYPLQGATLQKRIFLRCPTKAKPPAGLRVHDLEHLYAVARDNQPSK